MLRIKKNGDPISQRSRELTARIAELEAKIQKLHEKIEPADERPRFRSTAYPQNGSAPPKEPVFEPVDRAPLKNAPEPRLAPTPLTELNAPPRGWKGLSDRVKKYFTGSPASNPKLVTYLAAGNVQGLRPLRYEKRVARNRFLALTLVFVAVLFGIFYFLAQRR